MGTKWISILMQRCKDHIRSCPPSVLICRVSPYFRTMSLWTRTGPCTSVSIMGLDWYPYQCLWCRFGGARTGSFRPHWHDQIVLELCMHLWITLFTSSVYIRKPCPQFSWCEDWKTGWCTKAHTNFFANGNKRHGVQVVIWTAVLLIAKLYIICLSWLRPLTTTQQILALYSATVKLSTHHCLPIIDPPCLYFLLITLCAVVLLAQKLNIDSFLVYCVCE